MLATLGWSLSGLFARLLPGLDGWQITCWRGFWLSITLLVYLGLRNGAGLEQTFKHVPRRAMWVLAICFAIGTTCYVSSLTLVNTATVSIIGATSPLVTAMLSYWLVQEKPSPMNWIAGLLVMIGMALIVPHSYEGNHTWGLLLALAVPITFAVQTLLLRRYREFELMTAICLGGFLSFGLAAFASIVFSEKSAFTLSAYEMLLLICMGVVQLGLPLIFYGWGAKSVPAVTLALVATLDAVFNPFWSWAFANEVPDRDTVVGGSIILAAVVVSIASGQIKRLDPAHP